MTCLWKKETSGIWCITYRQEGKQKVRSLRTANKREAQKLQREVESLLEKGKPVAFSVIEKSTVEQKNPTLEEFWSQFVKWATEHRARSTVAEYKLWFFQFKEFAGLECMGDATKSVIEEFKLHLLEQGKGKPANIGIQKVSVNNAIKTLESIWNHSLKLGLYTGPNPFVHVERFRLPKKSDRRYLDTDEVNALRDAARKYADERYVKKIEAQNVYL